MAWPRSTHFGFGRNAVKYGRKGGRAVRKDFKIRWTAVYIRGYKAGFIAGRRARRQRRRLVRTGQRKGQAA
jgi:hypothetical protein